jgi:hypothetical protein
MRRRCANTTGGELSGCLASEAETMIGVTRLDDTREKTPILLIFGDRKDGDPFLMFSQL